MDGVSDWNQEYQDRIIEIDNVLQLVRNAWYNFDPNFENTETPDELDDVEDVLENLVQVIGEFITYHDQNEE